MMYFYFDMTLERFGIIFTIVGTCIGALWFIYDQACKSLEKKKLIKVRLDNIIDYDLTITNTGETEKFINFIYFNIKGYKPSFTAMRNINPPHSLPRQRSVTININHTFLSEYREATINLEDWYFFWKLPLRLIRGNRMQAVVVDSVGVKYKSNWIKTNFPIPPPSKNFFDNL